MTTDQWIAIAGTFSQGMVASATFWLGWRVYKHTKLPEKITVICIYK